MSDYDDKWEQQINALLDGELDDVQAEQLKSAAGDNRQLAQAIVNAYRLQRVMDAVGIEKAPTGLSRRLRAIPRQQWASSLFNLLFKPQWAMALASIPLIIIIASLMQPKTPSAAELAQARHDLATALTYLDKAGHFTGREIELSVGKTMADAVAGSVIRNIKSQYQPLKENKA